MASHNDLSSSNRDSSLSWTNSLGRVLKIFTPRGLHTSGPDGHPVELDPYHFVQSVSQQIVENPVAVQLWGDMHVKCANKKSPSCRCRRTSKRASWIAKLDESGMRGFPPVHHLHAAKSNASPRGDHPVRTETVGNAPSTRRPVTSINLDTIELRWT